MAFTSTIGGTTSGRVHHRQRWHSNTPRGRGFDRPRFTRFERVYGNGELTFGGLWKSPIPLWTLPVRPSARVFEIHRPSDWVHLVQAPFEVPPRDRTWDGSARLRVRPGRQRRDDAALLGSDRPLWLSDVFYDPAPLNAPNRQVESTASWAWIFTWMNPGSDKTVR